MGAVLILLSVAMGLTSYLVDAMIPDMLLTWVQTHIHSQVMFLLALNVLLLVLGSVLEIYSAIIILAPLIAPMGAAFGVEPDSPRRHLPREPGAGLPVPAGRAQPVPVVVALRQAADRASTGTSCRS